MKRECASLTKMMTALTVVNLARDYKIDLENEMIKFTHMAVDIRGTSATL